jgi:hypothetical protein
MALVAKSFTIYAPGQEEHANLNLSALAGVLTLERDDRGRRRFGLPAPFADVTLRDEETLTPEKAARLAEAIRHFQQRSGLSEGWAPEEEQRALGILNAAGVLATPVGGSQEHDQ